MPRCLKSILVVADEIIVVDTGSKDRTMDIARQFGAQVIPAFWRDNFSEVRNHSLRPATCDWILIIDADEELKDGSLIPSLLDNDNADCYKFSIVNVYWGEQQTRTFQPSRRLFRNRTGFKYENAVHNALVVPLGATTERAPVTIYHYGYDLKGKELDKKLNRNLSMLEVALKEDPNNPVWLYNMAESLRSNGETFNVDNAKKIIELTQRAAELTEPRLHWTWATHVMSTTLCGWAHLFNGAPEAAKNCALRAIAYKSDYLDAILLIGYACKNLNENPQAIGWLNQYLKVQFTYNFDNETDAITVWHADNRADAYFSLGQLYMKTRNRDECVFSFLMSLKLRPGDAESIKEISKAAAMAPLTDEENEMLLKFSNERKKKHGTHSKAV